MDVDLGKAKKISSFLPRTQTESNKEGTLSLVLKWFCVYSLNINRGFTDKFIKVFLL